MWFDSTMNDETVARRRYVRRRPPALACHEPLEARRLLSFAPATVYPVGGPPDALVTADFNDDTRPDVATANLNGLGVSVLLANGDGTFQPSINTATGSSAYALAAGDFNGDGYLDIVATSETGLSLLSGNGDGTFAAPQNFLLPEQSPPDYTGTLPQAPRSVAVGDLNGDGTLDLVATGTTSFTVGGWYCSGYDCEYRYYSVENTYVNVLLGNGDGTFAAQAARLVDNTTHDLAVGDLDNDGRLDVMTSHYGGATAMLGNGDGTLQAPLGSGTGHSPIALGDFDGDGALDLALRGYDNRSIDFHKGNGDGTFAAPQNLPVGSWGSYLGRILVGDVNGDGKLDLTATVSEAASNPYGVTSTDTAVVLLGTGDGSFALPVTSALTSYPGLFYDYDAALADFNGDGRPDLVMTHRQDDGVLVSLNDGDWVAAPRPPTVSIGDATVTEATGVSVDAVFTVTLSKASAETVTVQYAANSYTAISGNDFAATEGTLTFAPGETAKTVSVPVTGDATDEYDESFTVDLLAAAGADIVDSSGLGTIIDDDAAPSLVISDVSKREGRKGKTRFDFTVSLSAPSEKYVALDFATADGTAAGGSDYVATAGTLYFAPGQTAKAITVYVLGDRNREPAESFFVNLTGAVDATIADAQGIGTILDDDQHGRK